MLNKSEQKITSLQNELKIIISRTLWYDLSFTKFRATDVYFFLRRSFHLGKKMQKTPSFVIFLNSRPKTLKSFFLHTHTHTHTFVVRFIIFLFWQFFWLAKNVMHELRSLIIESWKKGNGLLLKSHQRKLKKNV